MTQYDENLEILLMIRLFPSVFKKIEEVLDADRDDIFENRSHFIRCAVNYFLNSAKIRRILEDDRETVQVKVQKRKTNLRGRGKNKKVGRK